MNSILPILAAVLNSLWQAALVAALVWLALKSLPRINVAINAATRHVIWWAALAVVLVLPASSGMASLIRALQKPVPVATPRPFEAPQLRVRPASETTAIVTVRNESSSKWPVWILAAWATMLLYRIVQIVRSYIYLCGVKRRSSTSQQTLPPLRRSADLLLSADVVSPMAVGFLSPAIILPRSLPEELEATELEHVLLHESAHLARYDDWTNLAVRLLGAVLALHPVALWILWQIEREREMACDDWVVARTGAARPYARSLARMSELRWTQRNKVQDLKLASGLFGGGSQIGDRIELLLKRGREFSPRTSLARVTIGTIVLLILAVAGSFAPAWIALAQPPDLTVQIKPGDLNIHKVGIVRMGDKFTATNVSLRTLIDFAYDVHNYRILGGPDWIDSATFTFEITKDSRGPTTLQTLLADRFKLAVHKETRAEQVYELVVDRGGSRLKPATDSLRAGREGLWGKTRDARTGATSRVLQASPVSLLAELLSRQLVRTVVDKTGLTRKYDFPLRWMPDPASPLPPDFSPPTLFLAVEEDLGLKLQPATGLVDALVIDHADKPDAN